MRIRIKYEFWDMDELESWKNRYSRIAQFLAMLSAGNMIYFIIRDTNLWMALYSSIPIWISVFIDKTKRDNERWKKSKQEIIQKATQKE